MEKGAAKRRRYPAGPDGGSIMLEGLGVSPGIGIGEMHVLDHDDIHIPEYEIGKDQVEAELQRVVLAREKAERQIKKLKTKSLDLHGSAA